MTRLERSEYLGDEDEEERDTECGLGPCRRIKCLQFFASKKVYVLVYGILGCIYSSAFAYSNSTISTIEKRFKLTSKTTGIISVGNDVSSMLATMLLSYYAGKGHRPRWLAAGLYLVALYCFINFLNHLLWGAGEDALALTVEHGGAPDADLTAEILQMQKRKTLCRAGLNDSLAGAQCLVPGAADSSDSGLLPAIIFFFANFISGIGYSLYYTLGVSYMDDNVKKSKAPFLVSVSYSLRMLGPAVGYTLGSYFLKLYIAPTLTPIITNSDARWLGAWWVGWLVHGVTLMVLGTVMGMFPHTLPRTLQRRREALQRGEKTVLVKEEEPSLKDMKQTIVRLLKNKIYLCNTLASVFYMFGFMPFWVFTPKYLEMQYRTTASTASFYTGSVSLVCSALGVLISGAVISRFKPPARFLAAWNVFVSVVSVVAILTYPFLGCEQSDLQSNQMKMEVQQQCNTGCHCDFVKYSPVCSEDGRTTFISACHAGCRDHLIEDGKKVYIGCSCVQGLESSALLGDEPLNFQDLDAVSGSKSEFHNTSFKSFFNNTAMSVRAAGNSSQGGGRAFPGPCPVDCMAKFYVYIAFVCLLKFSGASGKTSNFLVSVRCVEERDKSTSMGLSVMLFNIFVFVPSPILFGYLIDTTCVVWGKTCTGTGNCWQYDGESMRYLLNFTAAAFVLVGTLFDVGVWYYVKDLQIFDKKDKDAKASAQDENAGRELIEVHRGQDGCTPKQTLLAATPATNGDTDHPK